MSNNLPRLESVLRYEGLRYTHQRQAIWDVLCASDTHRDAEHIYLTLVNNKIKVSRATVYRTIEVLVKHGMLRKLDIGDGRSRYENQINDAHHDHLICINCGWIEEVVDNRREKLQENIASEHGFTLTRHNHQLFGLCENCQN